MNLFRYWVHKLVHILNEHYTVLKRLLLSIFSVKYKHTFVYFIVKKLLIEYLHETIDKRIIEFGVKSFEYRPWYTYVALFIT